MGGYLFQNWRLHHGEPRPNITKKQHLCSPIARNYTFKTKEELKTNLRAKNLKEALIERLEMADKGQTLLHYCPSDNSQHNQAMSTNTWHPQKEKKWKGRQWGRIGS